MLTTIAGLISLLIWIYLLAARGEFWRVRHLIPPESGPGKIQGTVAVIIPARNEAGVLAKSLRSLLDQSCSEFLHIFVVNDSSTDSTAEIAREAAASAGKTILTVLEGQPLPSGWSGKVWAMHQGVESARKLNPRFLLFADADIVHQPESVSRLVALAEAGAFDMASYMVKLHCETLAERFLIPAFVFFFFKLYPPRWIVDPKRRTAGAAGGCILLRPEVLDRCGGLVSIRNEIIDDCALARQVKRTGGRLWLGLTNSAKSIRPYRSLGEIGRMISRTAFNQLNHSTVLLFMSLLGLFMTYLLPPLLLFSHSWPARTLGAVTWIAMALSYLPVVRFYRLNPLWTITLPLITLYYMGATLHSAIQFWSGKGGKWKGRVQDVRGAEPQPKPTTETRRH
ncbi:MAG TPA: glycosyltransferase [Candidatus Angelobacter sp.]|jgi:hopene-associated glycosyltransferase HpnB|nr:glycosyltransferase [Candidatus Angelobacter sp.]